MSESSTGCVEDSFLWLWLRVDYAVGEVQRGGAAVSTFDLCGERFQMHGAERAGPCHPAKRI